ncbi:hypothetical protein ABH931_003050 [Streptacidiphilus sp. MAP12-33]|uniref:hypothetical protein n=1 Tax=Streptacidiphilus sp. MAP12-33 TaxID=3156266 RepID=UPI0035171B89
MKYFARTRRPAAVIALAVFAVGGVIGFAHDVRPDPGDVVGGLAPIHQTDPDYTGGIAQPASAPLTGF